MRAVLVASPVHVDRPSLRRHTRRRIQVRHCLAGPRGPAFIAAWTSSQGCLARSLPSPVHVDRPSLRRPECGRSAAASTASPVHVDRPSLRRPRPPLLNAHVRHLAGPRGPAFIAATQTADPTRRQRSLAGPRGPAFIAARRRWSSGQRRQAASPVHVDRPSLRRVKLGFDVDDNLLPRRSTWTGLHCGNSLDQGTQDLIIPRRSTWTGLHCGHAVDELGVVR